MQRVVTLGDGRRVTLRAYVAAWRKALAAPAGALFRRGLGDRCAATREFILTEFRDGMHDRINRHIPGYGVGRKWSPEWQSAAWLASRDLNMPRLRIYWLPAWLKERFAHRIASRED